MTLKKNKILGGFFLFLISLSFTPTITVRADDYVLSFEEEKDIIWERTYINNTLIQHLIDENLLSESYASMKVGEQTKYYIEEIVYKINGSLAHWKVLFHRYNGTNLENSTGTEIGDGWYRNVAKNPVDAASNWSTSASIFTNRFIPLNVSTYLAELVIAIAKPNITSSGLSLIYNNSVNGKNDTKIITYKENGIRDSYSIYYNGSLAYKSELVYYGEPYVDLAILTFAVIFLCSVVALGVIFAVVSHKKKKKISEDLPKKQPYLKRREEIKSKLVESSRCKSCHQELDQNAIFCPTCGLKIKKE